VRCAFPKALFSLFFFGSAISAFGQVPSLGPSVAPTTPAASAPAVPADPLGRETPRGTVLGFIHAAQEENYSLAIEYFQPPPGRHRPSMEEEEDLAADLLDILNQNFGPFLDSISRDPRGRLDDGLPPDQEKVGGVLGQSQSFALLLVRIENEHGAKLWLISRQTLDQVPHVYNSLRYPRIEKNLPKYLVENRLLAMPLWQWLAILLFLPIAIAIAWLLALLLRACSALLRHLRGLPPLPKEIGWRLGPGMLLVAAVIHYSFVSYIRASLLYRQYYTRIILVLLAIGFYWAITRITRLISRRIGQRLASDGRLAERSLVSLVRRALEVVIFLLLGFAVLDRLGYNVTAALAGLGIGGLAIGLGAQKTFENLLGGISILTDKAIVVGDSCRIGDQKGVVEDIGLRSTKLRTEDRTLVSIPNGTVATATLENYRLRDKILCRQTVRLRYDLSPDHVRYVLNQIHNVVTLNAKVEESTARVRLIRFADYFIEVEIYAYILERDYSAFLDAQEDLMLHVMETIVGTGAALALPSQTTLVTQDSWVDPEKAKAAQAAMDKSRDPGVPDTKNSSTGATSLPQT
jgi:MscS family membrane protein